MFKINLKKDKILTLAQEIKKNYPDLKINIIIYNNKILIKSSNKINFEVKKRIEMIVKIHIPESNLSFQNY
ncbi:MAG: hypothetical protein NZ866_00715 [Patescibacteria group bacterium]|nr:hypothetical protein [Patescibacteria group bacterium]